MIDAQFLHQPFADLGAARLVALHQLHHGHDILFDSQPPEDRWLLRQIPHAKPRALVHRQAGDVLAVDQDLALIDADEAGDHVEAGGLAGAVGAEQADDLAALEAQADALHDLTLAERLEQPVPEREQTRIIGVLFYINFNYPTIDIFKDLNLTIAVLAGVLVMGIIITWLSTHFATQRFLNLRTDDLY